MPLPRRNLPGRLWRLVLALGVGGTLMGSGHAGWAAEPALGLSALLEQADQQNPDLQAAQLRWEAQRARAGYAGSLDAPRIAAGIMNLASLSGPSLTVSQMFPGGEKRALATEAAVREAEMAEAELAQLRLGVARDLRRAYYEHLFQTRSLAIYRQTLDRLRNLRQIADAKYAVGSGMQQDPIRAQREVSMLLERGLMLEQEREMSRTRINTLASRPLDAPVELPPDFPTLVSIAPEAALLERAKERSPALRAMRARIEAQGAELRMARQERAVPDYEVGVQTGLSMPGDMPYLGGMVGINLPWLSPGRFEGRIKQSEATLSLAQTAYQAELNRLRGEIRELRLQLTRQEGQIRLYRQGLLPQATQSLQASLAAYQVNKTDFDAVLESQTSLFQVQTDFARAMADYHQASASLEALIGASIVVPSAK